MKLDFGKAIKNMDGSDAVMDTDGKGMKPVTVGYMISEALLAPNQDKDAERGVKMAHCYHVATIAYKEKEAELDEKDVELIKEYVGKNISMPLVIGQIFELLGQ